MAKRHVLVSGATSFIGRALVQHLVTAGHKVTAMCRSDAGVSPGPARWIATGDLMSMPIDPKNGQDVDVYINLAAPRRATSNDPSGLASDAARIAANVSDFVVAAEIPRTIVLSSIAAGLAEKGAARSRRYGVEKLAADRIFTDRLSTRSQLVVLRPPAVYGPGMKNSMSMLAAMVRSRFPIPLGLANEPRHYISMVNLCDLMERVVSSNETQWSNSSGKIFEPSDGTAVSTRNLVRMIGEAMDRRAVLIPFPVSLLRTIGAAIGRSELISGAVDRLDVAPSKELEVAFGWRPVEKMPESLAFLAEKPTAV